MVLAEEWVRGEEEVADDDDAVEKVEAAESPKAGDHSWDDIGGWNRRLPWFQALKQIAVGIARSDCVIDGRFWPGNFQHFFKHKKYMMAS
jgi:hypothetical protein